MAITILPRDYNPWVQALPTFLQNITLQKMSQRFRGSEYEADRGFRQEQQQRQQAHTEGLRTRQEEFSLKTSPHLQQVEQQHLPAGSDFIRHKGKFYVRRKEDSKDTTLINNYDRAVAGGYKGTLEDWKRIPYKSPKTQTLKGEGHYWQKNQNGKWVKTPVPVPPVGGGITFNAGTGTIQTGGQKPSGNLKDAALEGTGAWANIGAAIDAVAGGLGLDALVGKDGFFKTTQDARHQLRVVKQLGKSALMNSSRGAIWEQKKIDRLFPDPDAIFKNPRTEARKLKTLRSILTTEKQYNYQAMQNTKDPVRFRTLQESNANIERLLSHVGIDESSTISQEDDALIQKYLQGTP